MPLLLPNWQNLGVSCIVGVFSWTGSTEILISTLRVESITWDMNKSRFLISSEAIILVFSSKQVSRTGSECCRGGENEEEGEKMASTDYSTYSQAAAQQGYSAYTAQPTQGYAQTTQVYGKQSYRTYGQPTDINYTQAQSTATYRQTAYVTSYG